MVANRNIMKNMLLDGLGLGKVGRVAPHWEFLLYLSNWRQRIAWNEEYDETTKDWQVYSEFYLTNLEKDVSVGRWKGGQLYRRTHAGVPMKGAGAPRTEQANQPNNHSKYSSTSLLADDLKILWKQWLARITYVSLHLTIRATKKGLPGSTSGTVTARQCRRRKGVT